MQSEVYSGKKMSQRVIGVVMSLAMMCPMVAAEAAPEADGTGELFKANCALCHGDDGAGSALGARFKVLDLRSKEVQDKPAKEMTETIRAGKGNMPAFGNRLSGDQIDKLVEYVRHIKDKSK